MIYFMAHRLNTGEDRVTHPLIELSFNETCSDAADSVTVVGDLRPADGQAGGFSRKPGLQVEVDGTLVISLALLHFTSLLFLICLH